MESNASTIFGFKWVKKEDPQLTTKINAQYDCPKKAKSLRSIAVDHCPNEINYSRPHHQWIPKSSIYPYVNGARHGYKRIYSNPSPQRAPQRRKPIKLERRHDK